MTVMMIYSDDQYTIIENVSIQWEKYIYLKKLVILFLSRNIEKWSYLERKWLSDSIWLMKYLSQSVAENDWLAIGMSNENLSMTEK